MKITNVLPVPIFYAHRCAFLVKVETDAGIHGWGEGGLSGNERGMAAVVETLAEHLIGKDPRRIDHLWQTMFRGWFFEAGSVMSGALSAVDIALWDILGKHLGVPCWQLLGGRSRDRIECYIGCELDDCRTRRDEGWRYLRFAGDLLENGTFDPDTAARRSVEIMTQARETLGDEARLCIDLHTRFNPPAAAQICRDLEDVRPFFVEDPLRSPSPANYVAFRERARVPLAVGEECANKWAFQDLIEQDAIDYARVDVGNVGGLTEARKVAAMAETHYIDIVPHNPIGPIANAAAVHLSTAVPNFMVLEYGVGPDRSPEVFKSEIRFETPFYAIPEAPGLGIDVIESELKTYSPPPWNLTVVPRTDGGLNNW